MVMSIGFNPFYGNKVRSAEVHVLHGFKGRDFYGCEMRVVVLGFIRREFDYESLEALIGMFDPYFFDVLWRGMVLGEKMVMGLEGMRRGMRKRGGRV